MIRKILIPIDGSMHAQTALDLGADLAGHYGAQLILLHVVTHDDNTPEDVYDSAARELQAADERAAKPLIPRSKVLEHIGNSLLHEARQHARNKGADHVETIIDHGDAGKRILHHANNDDVDLIVMGSRGYGTLKGLVLGSVSHKVFHLAPCSCVTVHQGKGEPVYDGVHRILVPTDGSAHADRAVDIASDIAAQCGAALTFVYVTWRGPSLEQFRDSIDMNALSDSARDELDPTKHPVAEHVSAALVPPVISKSALKEIGEQVLARAEHAARAKGVSDIDVVMIDGDPARKIVQVAKRAQADLIAVGSRGLGGAEGLLAGSVSYKVNHAAPCSCLIVR